MFPPPQPSYDDLYERNFAPLHTGDQLRDATRAANRSLNTTMAKVTGSSAVIRNTDPDEIKQRRMQLASTISSGSDLKKVAESAVKSIISRRTELVEETEETKRQMELVEKAISIYEIWPDMRGMVENNLSLLIGKYHDVNKQNTELRAKEREQALTLQGLEIELKRLRNSNADKSVQSKEYNALFEEVRKLAKQRENEKASNEQAQDLSSKLVLEGIETGDELSVSPRDSVSFSNSPDSLDEDSPLIDPLVSIASLSLTDSRLHEDVGILSDLTSLASTAEELDGELPDNASDDSTDDLALMDDLADDVESPNGLADETIEAGGKDTGATPDMGPSSSHDPQIATGPDTEGPSIYEIMEVEDNRKAIAEARSAMFIQIPLDEVNTLVLISTFRHFDHFIAAEVRSQEDGSPKKFGYVYFAKPHSATEFVSKLQSISIFDVECKLSVWKSFNTETAVERSKLPESSRCPGKTAESMFFSMHTSPPRPVFGREISYAQPEESTSYRGKRIGDLLMPPRALHTAVANIDSEKRDSEPQHRMVMDEDIYDASPPHTSRMNIAGPAIVAHSKQTVFKPSAPHGPPKTTRPTVMASTNLPVHGPIQAYNSREMVGNARTHMRLRSAADFVTQRPKVFCDGLDRYKFNLLSIRKQARQLHPTDTPDRQVSTIMWTHIEWIHSHFENIMELRSEFTSIRHIKGHPKELLSIRMRRGALVLAVQSIYNNLHMLVEMNDAYPLVFQDLGEELLAAMGDIKVYRNTSAHLRDDVGAMSINEDRFLGFVHGGINHVHEAFKVWRERYMVEHEVLEFLEDLEEGLEEGPEEDLKEDLEKDLEKDLEEREAVEIINQEEAQIEC
ncbi:hypothetical protein BKA65DRAFT_592523 [Rhexocercosporidium sp. MPI-PUGE-AT-0058]|nr:hypothetical protein BKA65DRAFT_592523 [Rhexocercosporidium sp. MPI-PUGE-AT-0058]